MCRLEACPGEFQMWPRGHILFSPFPTAKIVSNN